MTTMLAGADRTVRRARTLLRDRIKAGSSSRQIQPQRESHKILPGLELCTKLHSSMCSTAVEP
eukprot:COSAG01_NODE_3126_length_6545_cov_7.559572_8_plen_63_part_00